MLRLGTGSGFSVRRCCRESRTACDNLLLGHSILGFDMAISRSYGDSFSKCKRMTDSTSNKSWGAFAPVMPSFIRLVAGVIVLVIIEAVVLGFPGISNPITGSTISVANIVVFMLGLIVCLIILKFGTQLADTVSDTYKNYRTWTPLLAYFFQIVAIGILYSVTNGIAQPYFTAQPWAYPLIFLLIALIPTIKVVVNMVHALEGTGPTKHSQN